MKNLVGPTLCLFLIASNADAIDVGVGVNAGTVGAGVNLNIGLTKSVSARISLSKIDISGEDESITVGDDGFEGDVDAELDFDFGASSVLFDWYIFNGGFHLTAGMMKNNGDVEFTGTLQSDVTLDGNVLLATDLGDISGDVSLGDSYQPYLGIGWGGRVKGNPGLSFTADIGIALLDPSVDLEATVAPASGLSQAELNTRLAAMEKDAEDELDAFEAWPIISIGLNYVF